MVDRERRASASPTSLSARSVAARKSFRRSRAPSFGQKPASRICVDAAKLSRRTASSVSYEDVGVVAARIARSLPLALPSSRCSTGARAGARQHGLLRRHRRPLDVAGRRPCRERARRRRQIDQRPGGQFLVGYKFDSHWDVALAGGVQQLLTDITQFRNGTLSLDMNHQHVDLEVGYSAGDWRFNAGLRGIHYLQGVAYNIAAAWSATTSARCRASAPRRRRRAPADRRQLRRWWAAPTPPWSTASSPTPARGVLIRGGNYWQLVPQLGGELGVNWRSSDCPGLLRHRGRPHRCLVQHHDHRPTTASAAARWLDFGPFVRLAYNFAGPSRTSASRSWRSARLRRQPAAQPGYMVYLRLRRSTITTVGAGHHPAGRQRRQASAAPATSRSPATPTAPAPTPTTWRCRSAAPRRSRPSWSANGVAPRSRSPSPRAARASRWCRPPTACASRRTEE